MAARAVRSVGRWEGLHVERIRDGREEAEGPFEALEGGKVCTLNVLEMEERKRNVHCP
jgi:hypothetical protein